QALYSSAGRFGTWFANLGLKLVRLQRVLDELNDLAEMPMHHVFAVGISTGKSERFDMLQGFGRVYHAQSLLFKDRWSQGAARQKSLARKSKAQRPRHRLGGASSQPKLVPSLSFRP